MIGSRKAADGRDPIAAHTESRHVGVSRAWDGRYLAALSHPGDPLMRRSRVLLATLATFSNQNSQTAGAYTLRGPFNLSNWAGQTVRIQFRGTNDISLPTSFRIDDVSVQ